MLKEFLYAWPMVLELWAPDDVGPQLEALDVVQSVQPDSSIYTGTAG